MEQLEKLVEKASSEAPPKNSAAGPGMCVSHGHPNGADSSVMLVVHFEKHYPGGSNFV